MDLTVENETLWKDCLETRAKLDAACQNGLPDDKLRELENQTNEAFIKWKHHLIKHGFKYFETKLK